jgi:hypothetical protein
VAFSVAINSAAPHVGGAEFEFPACMIFVVLIASPTRISQLSCDSASMAGVHDPPESATMAWPALA